MRKGLSHSEAGKIGYEKSRIKIQEMRQKRREEYSADPKKCKFCNAIMPYEKRMAAFCSGSCAASFNNRVIGRRWGKEPSCCLSCGGKLSKTQQVYCNSRCHHDHMWKQKKEMIKEGKYNMAWSGNKTLKRLLVEDRGLKCERCNNTEWEGEIIPLTVHHIDGDAKNNLPSNLQLLCWNCHGLTKNFGRNNKNCSRSYRYKNILPK